ncbi:MAG: hypothetical protein IKJ45_13875 [Kiritimatiellae bacterium]|nr:hypothetical protein [Kiritimatiellia bacterium]
MTNQSVNARNYNSFRGLSPVVQSPAAFLSVVAFMAFLTANSFGMCMALAIGRFPEKANEISSLMVMAIVGGGIVSAVLGFAQSALGPVGIVITLGVCIAYLFALGLFACRGNSEKGGRR